MTSYGTEPLVSIIIPTYNSQKTIHQCLQSIKKQTHKQIEAIIVDRYSADGTVQIAKQFQTKILLLNSERSEAKNLGTKEAKGIFLLFIDSDMHLSPKVVEECVTLCSKKNFDAVVIPEITVANGFLAECRRLERELYSNDPNFFLMPRFFKKNSFLKVKGFDEALVCGEDFDVARRYEKQGYSIGIANSPIKHLEEDLPLKKIALKAHYYGKSFLSFFNKEPALVMRGYCPTRFFRNSKRLLKHPLCLAGLTIIKLFEYIAYLTGFFAYAMGRAPLARDEK